MLEGWVSLTFFAANSHIIRAINFALGDKLVYVVIVILCRKVASLNQCFNVRFKVLDINGCH